MKTKVFIYLVCLSSLFACTTEVDLCHGVHPHRVDLDTYFEFGEFQLTPDSMVIFAVRNLNLLRYTYHLNAKGLMQTPAKGKLIYPDKLREPVDDYHDRISLHPGDYELVAFSGGSDVYEDNLAQVMDNPSDMVDSLWVTHKSYRTTLDHPLLSEYSDWISHNIYSDFILNGDREPTFAAKQTVSVPTTEHDTSLKTVFHANNLSQHITIEFHIKKKAEDGISIDNAVAELSGIPHRIFLMSGAVDVSRTFKSLYHPEIIPSDNESTTDVTLRGHLYVNGLVHSADPSYTTGPGILWVSLYAHAVRPDGTIVSRPIEACINLYHLLQQTPSLRLDEKNEAQQTTKELLLVVPDAVLNLESWDLTSQETSGLDIWHTLPNGDGNIGVDL